MYEQLKKVVQPRFPLDDSLESGIKMLFVEAYKLSLYAAQIQQDELAKISAYYIFDLLDWARCNLEGFSDDDVLFDTELDNQSILSLVTVLDFESMVEKELATPDSALEPALQNAQVRQVLRVQ